MVANNPLTLTVKPWTPDMPSFGSGESMTVRNVLPRTPTSYGPFPSLNQYGSTPLPARCQGAVPGVDPDGNVSLFAGTGTNLYEMTVGSTTFNNVSKSAGAYNLAVEEYWSFALIKSRLIATNISDPIQSFVIGTDSAFSDLSADAPKARYATGIKQFLMVGNTHDPIGGNAPWRVWWSAINDPTSWPTPGSSAAAAVQSDYNDIIDDGGWIMGLVGNLGTSDGAIFFEHCVWRIVYTGPPGVFSFFPAQGVRGTPAPGSIIHLGSVAYYLGEDGFYVFDGTNSLPIGANKIDKTFFADLDPAQISRITSAVDPVNKMVFWAYAGAGNNQGNSNRVIVYNWVTENWSIADINSEVIFRSLTFGYSLDGLDATGYNLDTLPYSLDSRAWTSGASILSAFDLTHTLCYFNGSNLAATVDTEEIQPYNGQRTFIRNARPLVDGGVPSIAMGTRELLTSTVNYTPAIAINSLGWSPQRTTGRYTRSRITLPAASTFTHIQGVQIDADPVGVR